MARKTREDYTYYSVSIRNELRIFFEAYIRIGSKSKGLKILSEEYV